MSVPWPRITALLGGTQAMRTAGTAYLPKWPAEGQDSYDARLKTATLFPAFARTIDVLAGKPFSKPVAITKGVSARVEDWARDIDMQGRDLHAFAAQCCRSAMAYGFTGILVDYPPAQDIRTVAQETAAGLRPYFVEIPATSLLGWRSTRINGAETITQLRFLETVTEDVGLFGERQVDQVRVLYPGAWEVYREDPKATGDDKWVLYQGGTTSLQKIPFVPIYGQRTGFLQARPPLDELAHLNVKHWQSQSDQQTILHVARVPILFGKGIDDETKIVVGANSAIITEAENADLRYVEHSGKAIEAGRAADLDLEDQMRQIGAELLVIKPGNTSTVQSKSDNEPGMCVLQQITQDQEQALGKALDLMGEWVGEETDAQVSIFQDFGVSDLAEASAEMLFRMKIDGSITHKTLLNETKRRGLIAPELDVDAEIVAANAEHATRQAAQIAVQEKVNI